MEPDKFDGVATHYYKHTSFCDGFWDVLVCPVTLSLSLSLSPMTGEDTHTHDRRRHTPTQPSKYMLTYFSSKLAY